MLMASQECLLLQFANRGQGVPRDGAGSLFWIFCMNGLSYRSSFGKPPFTNYWSENHAYLKASAHRSWHVWLASRGRGARRRPSHHSCVMDRDCHQLGFASVGEEGARPASRPLISVRTGSVCGYAADGDRARER